MNQPIRQADNKEIAMKTLMDESHTPITVAAIVVLSILLAALMLIAAQL